MIKRIGISLFLVLVLSGRIWAQASISVSSFEGGRTLNFGQVDAHSLITRELRIEAESQNTPGYQIRQVIIQPLTDDKGAPLKDDVIYFYAVRGSNAKGSLYKTIKEPLIFRDEILYISDSSGTSDTFKLVYVFDGSKLKESGSFHGKIGYILETKNGQSQTRVFNIDFDARIELAAQLNIPTGRIRLSTKSEQDSSAYLDIAINANPGDKISIYQNPEPFPANYKGSLLPQEALRFSTSGSRASGEYASAAPLENREMLIYSSDYGSDNLRINFTLIRDKLNGIEAGKYHGKLLYRIREGQKEKNIPVDIEISIEKIFDMEIKGEGLVFNIKPGYPPQEKTVLINVENNLQSPYQITQIMARPLTNEKGDAVAEEFFTMRQELLSGEGNIKNKWFSPVEAGESVIFTSEKNGEGASLGVIYRLESSSDIMAGNYSTTLTYSLSEK